MRFNELLDRNVREDIAVKLLYGEDLDVLAAKAEEMGKIIAGTVQGVGDMQCGGHQRDLPQMTVQYNRHKLAQYGVHVEDLNTVDAISLLPVARRGVIFEGEKRFDLVVRLDEQHRKSIDDLKEPLHVSLPSGSQIPLRKEVADDQLPARAHADQPGQHQPEDVCGHQCQGHGM